MSKGAKRRATPPRRGPRWPILVTAVAVIAGVGAGVVWWRATPDASVAGGTARLLVDRTEIDHGYQRFETPVQATFTLRNAGDGVLQIAEAPRVNAVLGC